MKTNKTATAQRKFNKRVVKMAVLPEGEPIFSEKATFLEILDESGGEFLEISQSSGTATVRLNDGEWPTVRDAIEEMFVECKKNSKQQTS